MLAVVRHGGGGSEVGWGGAVGEGGVDVSKKVYVDVSKKV